MPLTQIQTTDSYSQFVDKVNLTINEVNILSGSQDVILLTPPVTNNAILAYDGSNFVNSDNLNLPGNADVGGTLTVNGLTTIIGNVELDGDLNLATGHSFKVNAVDVLSATTLGSSVVNSSLTSLGTIATGVWNGTAVGPQYGGTGLTTYTVGDLLYASGVSTLSKLPIGSAGQVLTVNPGATGFSWETVALVPSGSDGQVQFNDGGSTFGGDAGLTYNKTTDTLTITGGLFVDTNTLVVDATNNRVGIGTNSPQVALDVFGAANVAGNVNLTTGSVFRINAVDVLSATTLGSSVVNSSLTSLGTIATGVWNGTVVAGQYGGTGVANTGKTITVSGNTVIGSSTHTVTLQTTANTNITLPTSGTLVGSNVTTLSSLTSVGTLTNLRATSLGVGTPASGVGGEIRATNDITAYYSSDERLKENIKNISEPLEKIKKINGVSFEWKDSFIKERGGEDGVFVRKKDVGIIAQEIQAIIPDAVALRDNGYYAVRYERIIPLLIECIKELSDRVEALEK